MKRFRVPAAALAFVVLFGGGLVVHAQADKKAPVKKAAPIDSPAAAMEQFVKALNEADAPAFLSFLSKKKSLRWRNYQATGDEPSLISYKEIARDFSAQKGLYYSFLVREDDGAIKGAYDCFADKASEEPWLQRRPATFYPPGDTGPFTKGDSYVRWRKEDGKWVIAEISYNTA